MGIIKSFVGANLIYIIVAAVIAAMVGAAYFYYQDTQKRLIQAAVERVHHGTRS
jgi:predicted negative regulator of RcsB-dependent stress response